MNHKIKIARLLRQEQTKAEKKLWGYLRNRQVENLKFRRQHPLKEYIVDFFCEEYGIIIELDGDYHNQTNQIEKDALRDARLENLGFHVLRFENRMVFEDLDTIVNIIISAKTKQKIYAEERIANLKKRKESRKNHLTRALSSRRGNISVLSTKVLTTSQQELLLNAGLGFTHYNAIKIAFLDFEMPEEDFDFYIFTSQNAVNSHIKAQPDFKQKEVFCVGEKTKSLLEKNGLKVREIAENSTKLAQIILKTYQNNSFLHIAGNLKTKDLPTTLKKHNIRYIEIEGYQTFLNSKVFTQQFDGTLFFSPSGVISFTKSNKLTGNAFCIGATTANEARKFTDKIIIAKKPTIENVIVQAVKNLKHD